jgi:hypothetical protein
MGDKMNVLAIESEDRTEFGGAQTNCVSGDRVKDGLYIGLRA